MATTYCDWCNKPIYGEYIYNNTGDILSAMLKEKYCSRKCVAEVKVHLSKLSKKELEARRNKAVAVHEKELEYQRWRKEHYSKPENKIPLGPGQPTEADERTAKIIIGCVWVFLLSVLFGLVNFLYL